ncbi:hypothetical protein, partial [uncultured Deinococcus sp.]
MRHTVARSGAAHRIVPAVRWLGVLATVVLLLTVFPGHLGSAQSGGGFGGSSSGGSSGGGGGGGGYSGGG